jgi:hypothetical protein
VEENITALPLARIHALAGKTKAVSKEKPKKKGNG